MPCLLIVLIALFPRAVILGLFFLSTYLERAYHNILVLLLGFIFLPVTTLVYAWIINNGHTVDGAYLAAIVVAVLFDMGLIGHGAWSRNRR